ncbi:D-amino acid oxidase [Microthyrium microscopicum]|uniref:D-amino acid oxidase n=1 Tax=Microthyrium microscopicum TaxID=703497 RepID=A0A6A6UIT9_9PEZI|nr:D-amino acid oxidase [Microthyrium microscopicum]
MAGRPVNVTVLGAGVIGLTTAMLLSRDKRFNITIIAKHMPGDYDIEYASPWAGANYLPVGQHGTLLAKLERESWPELSRLAREVPEAAIHFQDTVVYRREKDSQQTGPVSTWMKSLVENDPWYAGVVPDFRLLKSHELPPGHESGMAFTSVCINTALYLPWLMGQCLKHGATVKRGIVKHVSDAAHLHASGSKADVVINCTGLSSKTLGGVKDMELYPGRGQIILVRNESNLMVTTSGTDDGDDEATYIMQRAAGGGTILGGCLQANNSDSNPDPNLATRILKRSLAVCPALIADSAPGAGVEAISIVRHGVGLRPMRKSGPRVDKERIGKTWVVHSYGHGGYGYQSSYGSAYMVAGLVDEILEGRAGVGVERARL